MSTVALLLLAAGGGLAAALARGRGGRSGGSRGGGRRSPSSSWSAKSGVDLSPGAARFMDRLAAAVPGAVLVVTSATRAPLSQASAMLTKLRRGEDLFKLYRADDLLAEILAAPKGPDGHPTASGMADVIAAQAARGKALSRHLLGDAVDLRIRDPATGQPVNPPDVLAAIQRAASALGARSVLEADHLHIERLGA